MIALITPTGARKDQFNLCTVWMQKQTYAGKVAWIIVDDAHPRTTDSVVQTFRDGWDIHKVYPTPTWNGTNTQARNIAAGVQCMLNNYKQSEIEGIFIIEDDDYYKPIYLERMMANFQNYSLIGEKNTIYYNVVYRRWVVNPNIAHASLFQTAFKVDAIRNLEVAFTNKFIDSVLWSITPNKYLFREDDLAVGMKGMPGRGGIGAGHSRAFVMKEDFDMRFLKQKIGEDAKYYEGYYSDNRMLQYSTFAKRRL